MSDLKSSRNEQEFSLRTSSNRVGEKIIRGTLFGASAFSIFITVGILWALAIPAIEFFRQVPIMDF
jgi:ABC-type phosphate transport system permease subunit